MTKNKEVVRTTFHPDSDYSTFVGAYKPTSIEIPVRDVTGKVIVDMSNKGQQELILKGGRGGKGNSHFATSTRQAPRFAEQGVVTKPFELILELKTLADVDFARFAPGDSSTKKNAIYEQALQMILDIENQLK